MRNCSIEMDINYFIDLITLAHLAECSQDIEAENGGSYEYEKVYS